MSAADVRVEIDRPAVANGIVKLQALAALVDEGDSPQQLAGVGWFLEEIRHDLVDLGSTPSGTLEKLEALSVMLTTRGETLIRNGEGLKALLRDLTEDATFYAADGCGVVVGG